MVHPCWNLGGKPWWNLPKIDLAQRTIESPKAILQWGKKMKSIQSLRSLYIKICTKHIPSNHWQVVRYHTRLQQESDWHHIQYQKVSSTKSLAQSKAQIHRKNKMSWLHLAALTSMSRLPRAITKQGVHPNGCKHGEKCLACFNSKHTMLQESHRTEFFTPWLHGAFSKTWIHRVLPSTNRFSVNSRGWEILQAQHVEGEMGLFQN